MYLEKITKEGNRKRVLVLGLGSFGWTIATALAQDGHEVFAADKDEKRIKKINEFVSKTILLDNIDENVLKAIGVNHFDICIVTELVNCQVSNYTAITMKQLGCNYVMATVESDTDAKLLEKSGIDKVINPAQGMASRLAYSLTTTDIIDYIELSEEYQIAELIAPKEWTNKSLAELKLKEKHHITVLAIKPPSSDVIINPAGSFKINENDMLIVIATK